MDDGADAHAYEAVPHDVQLRLLAVRRELPLVHPPHQPQRLVAVVLVVAHPDVPESVERFGVTQDMTQAQVQARRRLEHIPPVLLVHARDVELLDHLEEEPKCFWVTSIRIPQPAPIRKSIVVFLSLALVLPQRYHPYFISGGIRRSFSRVSFQYGKPSGSGSHSHAGHSGQLSRGGHGTHSGHSEQVHAGQASHAGHIGGAGQGAHCEWLGELGKKQVNYGNCKK